MLVHSRRLRHLVMLPLPLFLIVLFSTRKKVDVIKTLNCVPILNMPYPWTAAKNRQISRQLSMNIKWNKQMFRKYTGEHCFTQIYLKISLPNNDFRAFSQSVVSTPLRHAPLSLFVMSERESSGSLFNVSNFITCVFDLNNIFERRRQSENEALKMLPQMFR